METLPAANWGPVAAPQTFQANMEPNDGAADVLHLHRRSSFPAFAHFSAGRHAKTPILRGLIICRGGPSEEQNKGAPSRLDSHFKRCTKRWQPGFQTSGPPSQLLMVVLESSSDELEMILLSRESPRPGPGRGSLSQPAPAFRRGSGVATAAHHLLPRAFPEDSSCSTGAWRENVPLGFARPPSRCTRSLLRERTAAATFTSQHGQHALGFSLTLFFFHPRFKKKTNRLASMSRNDKHEPLLDEIHH